MLYTLNKIPLRPHNKEHKVTMNYKIVKIHDCLRKTVFVQVILSEHQSKFLIH